MDENGIVLMACNAKTAEEFAEVPKDVFVITELVPDCRAVIIGKDEFAELLARGRMFGRESGKEEG